MGFFKEYYKEKRKARIELIQRRRYEKELNSKLDSLSTIEKSDEVSRILTCMYKFKGGKDYKLGYMLGHSYDGFVEDTKISNLWDEFGRLIACGGRILNDYDIIIKKPTHASNSSNLGNDYSYVRNHYTDIVNMYANMEEGNTNRNKSWGISKKKDSINSPNNNEDKDILFNKVCYKQEVPTIRQDCDLRLVRYLTNNQKQGFGLACEDNTLNGKLYTIEGEMVDCDLLIKEDVTMKSIIDSFKYLRSAINLLDIQNIFIDKLIAYLESENIQISNCSIAHSILLLSSKIAFTLTAKEYESDKEVTLKCVTLRLTDMSTCYDGNSLFLQPNAYRENCVIEILEEGKTTV